MAYFMVFLAGYLSASNPLLKGNIRALPRTALLPAPTTLPLQIV